MDKDQWQRIEQIFYAVMELPREEREGYLRQACAGDEVLYKEVQTLLDANRRTETFLNPHAALPQPPAGASSMRMKHCPKCGKVYPTITRLCQDDEEILSLKDPYHLVGTTLLDKYKILALVGLGGMGAVYCARHLGIDRRVALKILQPNLAIGNEYVVELFEREAKLAARLTHENIVDVKDAGHTPDGLAYIAMEWLEGRTLDDELTKGRFDFRRAIGVIRQIAAALSVAHAERIVHRDLKPANIMLMDTPDGRDHVKVLDFGIGKILKETTANSPVSALVGTPQYASPEQLTVGGHVDGRSDIYSLGIIFYRLLGGRAPFSCASMSELLHLQMTATPPSLSIIRPETPSALEALVNRMLAKQPAERPQSASEVIKSLEQISGTLADERSHQHNEETVVRATKENNSQADDLAEQTTEVMAEAMPAQSGRAPRSAPVRQTEGSAPAPTYQDRSRMRLLYALAAVLILVVGGYAFYRARFAVNDNALSTMGVQPSVAASATPSSASINVSAIAATPATTTSLAQTETQTAPTKTTARPAPTPDLARQTQANRQKAMEHFQRAQLLYQQGDYANALRECDESLQLDPQLLRARQLKRKINNIRRILQPR